MTYFDKEKQYQEYFKNFLGAWSFKDGDVILTISDIKEMEMFDQKTGGVKTALCVLFKENDLPLVLNVTNAETIASVTGSDIPQDWIGKRIKLGQTTIKVAGKPTTAVRVRDEVIKDREKMSEAQKAKILDMADAGIIDLPKMLAYFRVSALDEMDSGQAHYIIKARTGEDIE